MSTEEKAVQQDSELRQRMAKHLTALVFEQVDNNGDWLVHQEYTEGLVDAALSDWRQCFEAVNKELLEALQNINTHMIGMAAYFATCNTGVIIDNLETTIRTLHEKTERAEAAIAKARGIRGQ